uniref:Uncharacterized protein n=1 Tax=Glossina austeni TaxID=7395 RepID=A0A1A9VT23_GLOAU
MEEGSLTLTCITTRMIKTNAMPCHAMPCHTMLLFIYSFPSTPVLLPFNVINLTRIWYTGIPCTSYAMTLRFSELHNKYSGMGRIQEEEIYVKNFATDGITFRTPSDV